ncbi:MAG: DUF4422 domain-containing protein [Prolixibacteraceae bacterium]|jgi:hypothetical protein|nr:DUF4422 domain-containing protein [Prolixibacteraceae bacterium]
MKISSDIAIFIYYYKNGPILVDHPVYKPVMAGNAIRGKTDGFFGDDSGDSISEKNKYFSELTGIYWAWKNTSHTITGSCHYRRYFTARQEPFLYRLKRILYFSTGLYKKRYGLIYTRRINRFAKHILTDDEIKLIFSEYDAIFPVRRKLRYSVREHFRRYHREEDLDLLADIIGKKHPGYMPAFEQVMSGNRLFANNMFVLKKEDHERFMEWWFDLLFEFEKRIDKAFYQGYQQRIMGFLAERLLTVWAYHQTFRIKELPVIYFKSLKPV